MDKYKSFSLLENARQWAYKGLDTSKGQRYCLVQHETVQGYTEYFFVPNAPHYNILETINQWTLIEVWK